MKRSSWMTVVLAALFMTAISIEAQGATNALAVTKAAKVGKKAITAPPVPVIVTGLLAKEMKTHKGTNGVEKTTTLYAVTTAKGAKAYLRPNKTVTANILAGLVGKEVKVTGTGHIGEKHIRIVTLTGVEAVTAAKPAAKPTVKPVVKAPAAKK